MPLLCETPSVCNEGWSLFTMLSDFVVTANLLDELISGEESQNCWSVLN